MPKTAAKVNRRLVREYRRQREIGSCIVGQDAETCLRNARNWLRWERLEDCGLVRLQAEPEQENYFDVHGEPDDERERAEIVRQIELNGCWCVAGQYRTEPDGEWEWADSVGMCIYDHPLSDAENCYIPDIISTTIDALKTALRSRCPVCRKPR